jgi:hypothetical protein
MSDKGLSPATFRHVSSAPDVKAQPQRSEARRPKTAKVAGRARPQLAEKPARNARKAAGKPSTPATPVKPAAAKATKPAAGKSVVTKAVATAPGAATAKPVAAASAGKAALTKPAAPQVVPAAAAKAAVGKANAAAAAAAKPAKATKPSSALAAPPVPKKPARKSIKEAAGVSTDAVARRTGKSWDDWFEVLDTAGAATLDQRGIIAILAQKHGIGPWWQQMIAVGYESLRGASEKPPAADGFHINSSCTLDAPLPRVFRLWNDAGERARWLADDRFVVRGATADKVIRARWGKGASHVAVSFAEKSGRTEVSVEHHQIESRVAAEQMKAYWAKKLGLLDQALAPRR